MSRSSPMSWIAVACCSALSMSTAWAASNTHDTSAQDADSAAATQNDNALEAVASFGDDFKLVGIGVSSSGRIFASAPSGGLDSGTSLVEVDSDTGKSTPYPNIDWNHFKPDAPGMHQWIAVQALWVDADDHLWALDKSSPKLDAEQLPPKLVEFDLSTDKVVREYTFENTITPKDSLNDVRVDLQHGYAYLTDAANQGGLVVLNLKTGQSRLVLAGDRSSVAESGQHLMFDSRIARRKNGKILVLQSDGIALSPDRKWVYYRPLTDHNYWRIPTASLIDESLPAKELAASKQFLGTDVMSGGIEMDDDGVLYAGDLEKRTVVALTPVEKGDEERLDSTVLVKPHPELAWADGFAVHDGYLYIADSHLNEVAFSNGYPREGRFTIFRVKLLNHG